MKHAEAQSVVLARMAESRAELIAAHMADEPMRIARAPRRALPASARPAPWFLRTPNAELIALALVGVAILGLRRTVQTAVGAGLSASTHRAFGDLLNALRE
ncbi:MULTISPECIES: hypothetical protein [Caballeronia]|jgi:hypothetical protein|uniref:Uncharacterized protein n=1 Tax=Caballeronia zhejiangensis TaxID=871203 RepID=A0A656QPR2_9BURK|nr:MULTISPECIES: hypothetical protein [Caballeronia]EKS69997.1 hypothetical protein BURK_018005 [Burkholderia sp. SJ98]KDR32265.1 hypothetical protein BG60_19515 [Caballeronia zhejiangensis]MDR5767605.1 hypothetical protein [Caballeronia sp. LZ028]MDR5790689.1 hypothetical protein [Caballeronia sp. LP003]MDR5796130.1 hypothetical protein [Caballeronia sp. LZ008]